MSIHTIRIYLFLLSGFFAIDGITQQPSDLEKSEAEAVYSNLKAVLQVKQYFPTLLISEGTKYVAGYKKGTIILERKACRIAMDLLQGPERSAAIAFLIGHELSHFYSATEESSLFLNDINIKGNLAEERQADITGAFIAQIAGYPIGTALPLFLPKLYRDYQMFNNLPNYPSLTERMSSADAACSVVNRYADLFDAANLFIVLSRYREAEACFQFLIEKVRFPELHNNLGIAQLAFYLQSQPNSIAKYYFPFDLDINFSIRFPEVEEREAYLVKARENFIKTLEIDTAYCPAYLNYTTSLILMGKFDDATKVLSMAGNCPIDRTEKAKLQIVKGILAAMIGKFRDAKTLWEDALRLDNSKTIRFFVEQNNAALTGGTVSEPRYSNGVSIIREKLDNIDLLRHKINTPDYTFNLSGDGIAQQFSSKKMTHSHLFQLGSSILQVSNSSQALTQKGIGEGATSQQVIKLYGKDFRIIATFSGAYMVYSKYSLFFQLNKNDRVCNWGVYAFK